jgi:phosphoribosylformimino-5-aminoimidazole carboxamide ribonucleotide (ProFAR) isomerase
MLIPSIDLQEGRVVQLVQGERLALATDDLDGWLARFAPFPIVQVIDLDAAKGSGDNASLVELIARRRACRVGGGVRSVARARGLIATGARQVIVGSALFRDSRPNLTFAGELAAAVGRDAIVAALDSRGGRVVVDGWRTALDLDAVEAARILEPFCGGFLYTHVDTEGLMRGTDFAAIEQVRAATILPVAAAGGITTREEIDRLAAMKVDAVVGMAIYTQTLDLSSLA